MMPMDNPPPKEPNLANNIIAAVVGGALGIAAMAGAVGLAIMAIKFMLKMIGAV